MLKTFRKKNELLIVFGLPASVMILSCTKTCSGIAPTVEFTYTGALYIPRYW
jgi:hypothetical protein